MDQVQSVKETLEQTLNPSVLSTDSLHGLLIIVVISLLVWYGIKHTTRSIVSILSFILLIEIGHVVAYSTSVGESAPILKEIFKYDVFTALAQLCVGTKVASVLLYMQAWLNTVMQTVVDYVEKGLVYAGQFFKNMNAAS